MLLPYLEANRIEAGCDEVGRGCLAGPVVAASVILPADYSNKWINDSKKLGKSQRENLRILIVVWFKSVRMHKMHEIFLNALLC